MSAPESAAQMLARAGAMVRDPTDYCSELDVAAVKFMLETRADLLTALRVAVLATVAIQKCRQEAADEHNNSDACRGGNYVSVEPLPSWVAEARSVIAKATRS